MKQGNQRVKGAVFERKIANILKHIWPDARRGIQYRDGGKEASDVVGTPYHVECSKGGESIWAKWGQAKDDALRINLGDLPFPPIVIKQRDREEPVVMMSLKKWLELAMFKASITMEFPDVSDVGWKDQYKKEFGNL